MRSRKQKLLDLLPDSLVMVRGPRHGDARYLTFDDGPDPLHTAPLLDLLARYGVKASFFLVGNKVEQHPELVQRMVDEGHLIGNHSYSHYSFRPMSLQKKLYEIDRTDALLRPFSQRLHHPMRPPRGDLAPSLLLYFAAHRRSLVHWSYDSLDFQDTGEDALIDRLRRTPPQAGDIVLMHDDSHKAAAALGVLLPEWLAQGQRFHALPAVQP